MPIVKDKGDKMKKEEIFICFVISLVFLPILDKSNNKKCSTETTNEIIISKFNSNGDFIYDRMPDLPQNRYSTTSHNRLAGIESGTTSTTTAIPLDLLDEKDV